MTRSVPPGTSRRSQAKEVSGGRPSASTRRAHGATVQQILEVMELSSMLGLDAVSLGVPIMVEELRAAGRDLPG